MRKIVISTFIIILISSLDSLGTYSNVLASQSLTFEGRSENWSGKVIFSLINGKLDQNTVVVPKNIDEVTNMKFKTSFDNNRDISQISTFEQAKKEITFVKIDVEWIQGQEKRKEVIIAK
ncbi:hypothetical protein AM501_00050 [Aneurinibacillus migulanus]|uniref:Uncharacterized protein n=1 Tax=Aneurinibacillus migulanus TaxID=47500 RepID=A0A0D1V7I0_ANEMI|nr:hypothetical protein [Aneurinibacillus migulanus]KIV52549.1 hypothetical protein TS64_22355 [Aneurinibacillus migulanus]KIV55319.1 hypothetical protein TS65_16875 [Aneurinibacillus migulanus]KON96688.1 hypothetical protein AF333_15615 [Aneurinibacillus migulanus]KPD10176.1 hypothetical protein AM501_00050 [Aneurinibacillus migulanus]MED0896493.1 hypothetical protein [Aneurinibacillus migulanus]